MTDAAALEALRPRLIRVAYRMLSSVADAEDVVQDAYIRWQGVNPDDVDAPEAYLRRVVTRLCLDVLKSARRRRETYIGPWLPEPVVEEAEEPDDVTLPLMLALERLSPLERAAFLLHDVFGVGFDEIGRTLDRDAAACRQLASRARTNVRADRPRFPVAEGRGLQFAEAFFNASRSGDLMGLQAMLADDVLQHADGGGKRPAAFRLLHGVEDVMKVQAALARRMTHATSKLVRYGWINGLPGFVTLEADGLIQTTALAIEGDRIVGIYIMRNPDKLQRLDDTLRH